MSHHDYYRLNGHLKKEEDELKASELARDLRGTETMVGELESIQLIMT